MNDLGTDFVADMLSDEELPEPSWIWFASSAFPMISGTLGPVASAFSICSLVRPWRQYYPPGSDIQKAEYRLDPKWLTAINAIQLAIAVVANLSLLLNMGRKMRFSLAQPVTIVGWYFSSICLIALAATAAGPLEIHPVNEYVWSQAFYYGVYAAILYFIVASLMTITFLGAQAGYYDKDFMLTSSQRTLMLQTIMFLMYLLIGALVFSTIEGWNYLDALYWADVTLFTVGFGDFSAATTLGRALLFPYALIGVISLGLVIGSIRSLMLDRGRRKINTRMVEKKRQRKLRRLTQKGKGNLLEPVQSSVDNGIPTRRGTDLSEFDRRREEFKLMRKIQHQAAQRRRWLALAVSTGTWLVLWLVGAEIFLNCEQPYQNWTYFDAFYLCFVSLTTIGYGDVTPISNAGKSFFVFWSLLALPTMTVLISNAGDTVVKAIRDATNQLGTITILPGDQGFKKDLKRVVWMMSCGTLFEDDIQDTPPGFLGGAQRTDGSDSDDEDADDENDEGERSKKQNPTRFDAGKEVIRRAADQAGETGASDGTAKKAEEEQKAIAPAPTSRTGTSTQRTHKKSSSTARRGAVAKIPAAEAEYRLMLIEEIAKVTRHLKHKPPVKYTFVEWAWYLKLIGQDEANAETHRKAVINLQKRTSNKKGEEMGGDADANRKSPSGERGGGLEERQQWSWVGDRSPLMSSQDEAEWVLEKLVRKLAVELRRGVESGEEVQAEQGQGVN